MGYCFLCRWIPSIRKLHEIPSFPEFEVSPDSDLTDTDIGLGYDPLAKDYKHVRLIFLNYKTLHSVAIYSLGGGSWKTIKFQGKGSSCSNWRWGYGFSSSSVYFQGSLYLIVADTNNVRVWDLVSFDLSREVFSSISMPDDRHFRSIDFTGRLALIDGGCSLAVFETNSEGKSVWVLESESMKWTKRFWFRLKCNKVLYIKMNGDILIQRDRGEKKSVRWDQVASYCPETDECKIVQERASFCMFRHVCGYVQSLILHK